MNENNVSTPFMTSPIGNLTLDSDGLHKAIDEITRCHREIALLDKRIEELETAAFIFFLTTAACNCINVVTILLYFLHTND